MSATATRNGHSANPVGDGSLGREDEDDAESDSGAGSLPGRLLRTSPARSRAGCRPPTSTSATPTTSARRSPACGCSPACTSAARSGAWATSPRRDRSCSSATTRAATSRPTRPSSPSPSTPTSASSGPSTSSPTTSCSRCRALSFLRRFGTVAASPANAEKALRSGAALLVYPGGDYEVHRPSWHGNRVEFAGRRGFIRLALEHDVPIVPVVSIGGQETALFLSRGETLSQAAGPRSAAAPEGPADLDRRSVGHQRRRLPRPHPAAGQDHGRGAATHPPARRVRPRARRRRGLRARAAPHAGDPRRARRRAPPADHRMRVQAQIEVAAPPAAVWEFVIDPARYLHFMAGMTRWEVAGELATGMGARYRTLMRVGSAEVGGLVEIVEWDEGCDLAWTSVTGVDQRGRWRLRALGRTTTPGCELRLAYGVAGSGILGWVAEQVAAPTVRGHLRRSLQQLKRQVEHERLRRQAAQRRSERGVSGAGASARPRRKLTVRRATLPSRRSRTKVRQVPAHADLGLPREDVVAGRAVEAQAPTGLAAGRARRPSPGRDAGSRHARCSASRRPGRSARDSHRARRRSRSRRRRARRCRCGWAEEALEGEDGRRRGRLGDGVAVRDRRLVAGAVTCDDREVMGARRRGVQRVAVGHVARARGKARAALVGARVVRAHVGAQRRTARPATACADRRSAPARRAPRRRCSGASRWSRCLRRHARRR